MTTDLAALNAKFGLNGEVTFKQGQGGLDVAEVNNKHAKATILLQGAHLMTWAPKGEKPVIWMSRDAKFVPVHEVNSVRLRTKHKPLV